MTQKPSKEDLKTTVARATDALKSADDGFVAMVAEELEALDRFDEVYPLWQPFLGGHWTKTPPTVPGTYPTADRGGNEAEDVIVGVRNSDIYYNGHIRAAAVPDYWTGWWWSEPRPPMPPAPLAWGEDET